jgi:hypothetical protein
MMRGTARRYKLKETLKVIARDLGASRHCLVAWLRDHGVTIRRVVSFAEQTKEIRHRYSQDKSLVTIGEKTSFDAGTTCDHLIAVSMRLRGCHSYEQ